MVFNAVVPPRRRDGDGETVHAEDDRDPSAEAAARAEPPRGSPEPGDQRRRGRDDGEPGQADRARVGTGRGAYGRGPGGPAVRPPCRPGDRAAGTGVRLSPHGAAPSWRDAGAAPPRIPGAQPERLPVHAVLRDLPALGGAAPALDAARSRARREALRRLIVPG